MTLPGPKDRVSEGLKTGSRVERLLDMASSNEDTVGARTANRRRVPALALLLPLLLSVLAPAILVAPAAA
jgi:hypothetical protein